MQNAVWSTETFISPDAGWKAGEQSMEDAVEHTVPRAVGQAQKMCGDNISRLKRLDRKARQVGEREQRGTEGWAG